MIRSYSLTNIQGACTGIWPSAGVQYVDFRVLSWGCIFVSEAMLIYFSGTPTTRIPGQLVRPTATPHEFQLGRWRHSPSDAKQSEKLSGEGLACLRRRNRDSFSEHEGQHGPHHGLGPRARTCVGTDCGWERLGHFGKVNRSASGPLAWKKYRTG